MERPTVRHKKFAFVAVTAILSAALLLPKLFLLGCGALLALVLLFYITSQVLEGQIEPLLLLWAGIFPLGYYFLTFPRSQALITFDRVTVLLLGISMVFTPKEKIIVVPTPLRRCGLWWGLFLLTSLLSLLSVQQIQTPLRLWLDSFLLPAILGWYVITRFPVRSHLRALHALISVASIYSTGIAAAEIVLGTDLLPLPGAGDVFAGVGDVLVLRPNGPFLGAHELSLIGLISFCLLGFLRHVLGPDLPRWQRILHGSGMTAGMLAAIMLLSRSVFIIIVIIFLIDIFRDISWQQKAVRLSALALMAIVGVATIVLVPDLFRERISDPGNIYARVAQQQQNLRIFFDHPIVGVGLENFYPTASTHQVMTSYEGIEALEYPHSNLGAILAETGVVGFVPYVVSQFLMLVALWKVRAFKNATTTLAATFLLYFFLVYWIHGLSTTSGYSSPLNLWYMFALAVVFKYAMTAGKPAEKKLPPQSGVASINARS